MPRNWTPCEGGVPTVILKPVLREAWQGPSVLSGEATCPTCGKACSWPGHFQNGDRKPVAVHKAKENDD